MMHFPAVESNIHKKAIITNDAEMHHTSSSFDVDDLQVALHSTVL